MSAPSNPEKDLAAEILACGGLSLSGAGLRFDRVVLRVLGDLRAAAERELPAGTGCVVTLSAPIREAAKTAAALADGWRARAAGGDLVSGNAVSLRLVRNAASGRPKLVGFVHNPEVDPAPLVDLAERWLMIPSSSRDYPSADPPR